MSEVEKSARDKREEIVKKYDSFRAISSDDYSILELLHYDVLKETERLYDWVERRIKQRQSPYNIY